MRLLQGCLFWKKPSCRTCAHLQKDVAGSGGFEQESHNGRPFFPTVPQQSPLVGNKTGAEALEKLQRRTLHSKSTCASLLVVQISGFRLENPRTTSFTGYMRPLGRLHVAGASFCREVLQEVLQVRAPGERKAECRRIL